VRFVLLVLLACLTLQARDIRVKLFWKKGQPDAVATMPLEDYVAGVLAGESSTFTSDEALKAMAVAARSFALHHLGRHGAEGFDFCDTTHCQDLRLSTNIGSKLRDAVDATEAEILWFNGSPAATYYHRHCGGNTAAAHEIWPGLKAPYLRSAPDTFCVDHGDASWRSELPIRDLDVARRTESGRVTKLSYEGRRISAERFQRMVGEQFGWNLIRSNYYDIAPAPVGLIVSGRGFGHGVGLCQTGADARGKAGHDYARILSFYYPGARLGTTAEGIRWKQASGERADAFAADEAAAKELAALGDRAIAEAERTGFRIDTRPRLRTYSTIARYRDATGSAGWVAATTAGPNIRMQPLGLLRSRGELYRTVLHEVLHLAVDTEAHSGIPDWFREGLVLYLSNGQVPRSGDPGAASMRRAYVRALARVNALAAQHGRATLLEWLRSGLPPQGIEQGRQTRAAQPR
jgi:stage II sporulation protein D